MIAVLTNVFIARYRGLYDATGNGSHALRAYALARRFRQPVPDWVLAYFDKAVQALFSGPRTGQAVAPAFELNNSSPGGSLKR